MYIFCIGIGVSFSFIHTLPNVRGVDILLVVVCLLRAMKEYRDFVIKRFLNGERSGDIFWKLKSHKFKRNVYTTIRRYQDTSPTNVRVRSGRPRSASTPRTIKVGAKRFAQSGKRLLISRTLVIKRTQNVRSMTFRRLPAKKRLDRAKMILSTLDRKSFFFGRETVRVAAAAQCAK